MGHQWRKGGGAADGVHRARRRTLPALLRDAGPDGGQPCGAGATPGVGMTAGAVADRGDYKHCRAHSADKMCAWPRV